ncbi:hypothetical protein Tco_1009195 [Tanacetum coccineum]
MAVTKPRVLMVSLLPSLKNIRIFLTKDIFEFVDSFLASGTMPQGVNSSFFTLIPKVSNPIHIKDFRPISLIGIHYKIIAKILANRLSKVIDKINSGDLDYIIRVLHVFYLASGLKINIHKSNIFDIGVPNGDVVDMARQTGCTSGIFPFTYLSLLIGSNMNLVSSWQFLIDRFHTKLSSWKANLLSIGGRLTLIKVVLGSLGIYLLSIFKAHETVLKYLERYRAKFFWGGSQDSRKLAWIKWSNAPFSFDKGDLNIGSLKAFNLALLQKWRRRAASLMVSGLVLLAHLINSIPLNTLRFHVGCGTRICFWKDIWIGDSPLYTHYSRLFRLDYDKDCLIIDCISNGQWKWNWSREDIGVRNKAYLRELLLEISLVDIIVEEDLCVWDMAIDGIFSVGDTRRLIDAKILPTLVPPTSWDKTLQRKVNIFIWRLPLDRLPHRLNLSTRGMDIAFIACTSCNGNVESSSQFSLIVISLRRFGY